MAFLQELSGDGIREAIELLGENNLVVALTVRYQAQWVSFRSRALAQHNGVVWVQMPETDHLPTPYTFKPGEQVGAAFSMAHRKFVFASQVVCVETYTLDGTTPYTALRLGVPERMHKIERRRHERLDMSGDELTEVAFWLGGRTGKPDEASVDAPVWPGRVLDISKGGMLVRTSYGAAKYVEVGDIVGVQITFGGNEMPIVVDAQVRHCARDGEMALIGLEFVDNPGGLEDNSGVEQIRGKIDEQLKQKAV